MTNIEKVMSFLDQGVWFFLTTDGDQPKGRPFTTHILRDDQLFFTTGDFKKVYKQMNENPKVEILAAKGAEFMRFDGIAVIEKDDSLANEILSELTDMQKLYNEETGYKLKAFHIENGKVEICTPFGVKEEFTL